MTKDVLVTISGIQLMDGEDSDVSVITPGNYYMRNGKHYITYDEVLEGFEGNVKNTIKIQPDSMDIIKSGIARVHLVFGKNQKNVTSYATPMGNLVVGLETNNFSMESGEDRLRVQVSYSLDINYGHVSDCNISVDVQSRALAQMDLNAQV